MTTQTAEGKSNIGTVTHYFAKISVAAIKLTGVLKVGDMISIEGSTTLLQQQVESMQIENKSIDEAKAGDEIGMKVKDRVREGDKVFLVQ